MVKHEEYMREALRLAQRAFEIGEVPIGAVVVCDGEIVGQGYNRREIDQNPLAHAEVLAIKEASAKLGRWRLTGCSLYVSLEPCPMCAGALVNARVENLYIGALDPKAGAVYSLMDICSDARLNHRLKVQSGILANESSQLMKQFFSKLRE